MVLTAYFVLSPARSGLFVPVILRLLGADLTPASRRQNHTTSPSASAPFVKCAARVHRIPPRVRDVRNAPLLGQHGTTQGTDLGQGQNKIFLQMGLDRQPGKTRTDLPVGSNRRGSHPCDLCPRHTTVDC